MTEQNISEKNSISKDAWILRCGIAFIWLATGFLVLHPYYREAGSYWLSPLGLSNELMYITCAMEIILGLYLVFAPSMPLWLALFQTALILGFTAILACLDPMLLAHPFGMLSKNLPILGTIWTIWYLQKEGWTHRTLWILRVGMALIWITEGLFPKVLFQQPMEVAVVANSGLVPIDPAKFLMLMGIAQFISGIVVLLLKGKFLKILLYCQMLAVMVLPLLVSWQDPLLWIHPFGPMTKNIPILVGTWMAARRC